MRAYTRVGWAGGLPLSTCPDCGNVVHDRGVHDAWHDAMTTLAPIEVAATDTPPVLRAIGDDDGITVEVSAVSPYNGLPYENDDGTASQVRMFQPRCSTCYRIGHYASACTTRMPPF